MAEQLFDLIFLGADLDSVSRDRAVEALRILLGANTAQADEILSSRQGLVLRSGLSSVEVKKLQTALVALGIRCNYKPSATQSLKLEIVPLEHEENVSPISCPECQARITQQPGQPRPEVCPECGLVFAKHEQSVKEQEERATIRRKLLLAQQTLEQEQAEQAQKDIETKRRLELEADVRKQLGIPAALGSRPRLIGSAAALFLFGIGSGFLGAQLLYSSASAPSLDRPNSGANSAMPSLPQANAVSEQDLKLAVAIANGKPNLQLLDLVESIVSHQGSGDQSATASRSNALPGSSDDPSRRPYPEFAPRGTSGVPVGATLTGGLATVESLRTMVAMALAQHDTHTASALLAEMRLRAENLERGVPRIKAHAWLAGLLGRAGQPQEGKQLLAQNAQLASQLASPEERTVTAAALGAEMTRLGQASEGLRLFQVANHEFSEITDVLAKFIASCDLAESYALSGQRGTALNLLDSVASGAPKIPDSAARDRVLGQLALANARVLDPEGAEAAIAAISSDDEREEALYSTAREFIRTGHTLWASDIAARSGRPYFKTRVMSLLAEARANAPGGAGSAEKAFAEAELAARSVATPSQKVSALAGFGRALAGAGNNQRSQEMFNASLQIAKSLDAQHRAAALAAIVEAQLDALSPELAVATLSQIADPGVRARLLTEIEGTKRIAKIVRQQPS